ncbi:FAD-dependent oxidoreductase [Planctomycetaceae bacterium SH139]
MSNPRQPRDLVLLGVGHTHLHVLREWQRRPLPGIRLTCISNQPTAAYSGMLPGTLAGNYTNEEMQIDLSARCAEVGAELILAETTGLDRTRRQVLLRNCEPVPYDWLSIGIGSRPADVPGIEQAISIKPMQTFLSRLEQSVSAAIRDREESLPLRIVVVGGGSGGVEIALCLPAWLERQRVLSPTGLPRCELTVVQSDSRLLGDGNPRAAAIAERTLSRRGHRVLLGHAAVALEQRGVVTEQASGERQLQPADLIIWVVGAVAPRLFEQLDLARDERGFLLTNQHLQSVQDSTIFVVGDAGTCQDDPQPKAGVYAVRQGPVLWENLQRISRNLPLSRWQPQAHFLSLLNTGDCRAIFQYRGFAIHARWCWWLKDFIDRQFIAKHSAGAD